MGHTLDWIASELGIPPHRLEYWTKKGLFRGLNPGQGSRSGYSAKFLARARHIHEWLQYSPRGPLENLRDQLYPEDMA